MVQYNRISYICMFKVRLHYNEMVGFNSFGSMPCKLIQLIAKSYLGISRQQDRDRGAVDKLAENRYF